MSRGAKTLLWLGAGCVLVLVVGVVFVVVAVQRDDARRDAAFAVGRCVTAGHDVDGSASFALRSSECSAPGFHYVIADKKPRQNECDDTYASYWKRDANGEDVGTALCLAPVFHTHACYSIPTSTSGPGEGDLTVVQEVDCADRTHGDVYRVEHAADREPSCGPGEETWFFERPTPRGYCLRSLAG